MRAHVFHALLIRSGLGVFALAAASGPADAAQQQINLTAGPSLARLPDGSAVPMWGYRCGPAVTGSTATCAPLDPSATAADAWSPVVITVPSGQGLTINLTNNLSFTPTGSTTRNDIPTSLVIVGQLGGGLGSQRTVTASPDHSNAQAATTWPIANSGPSGSPPAQGARVQSLAMEVAALSTAALTWTDLRPGTYLIESGTHPSIQGPMGLYGMLVVTTKPSGATPGTGYGTPGTTAAVTYGAELPLLMSEIDPVQNGEVDVAVHTAGFSETMVWSGQPGGCGNPSSTTFQQCYPPAVNYTPLYYLFNGVAFDRTNASRSLFAAVPGTSAAPATGSVLVRLVNAGLRMHVPSIVGAQAGAAPGFALVAEDGNVLPGVPRVQSEVFMAAGKTYDVLVNVPATPTALPIYDRELSLSGNAVNRDAGMLAYIGVNGATAPTTPATVPATANPDVYTALVAGQTLTVSDPSRGVTANDVNVYGVRLVTQAAHGVVTLDTNGTFSYVPSSGSTATSDSFGYCANGAAAGTAQLCTTVTLSPSNITNAGVTCSAQTFGSSVATSLAVATPGVLAGCADGAHLPLQVVPSSVVATAGLTVRADASGGFTASLASPCTNAAGCAYTFAFQAQNSQGKSSAAATVTVTFPQANGPKVTVLDGADKTTVIGDYRWIIEEDRTFYVDPSCTQNPLPAGCPAVTPQGAPAVFGTNFHTSFMPVVATGCTGPLSCESGQKLLGAPAVCDVGNGVCRTDATQQTPVDPSLVHLDPSKRYYLSVLPGDAANPFTAGYTGAPDCSATGRANGQCGHGMGGAPIARGQTAVTVLTQPSPYPPAKLTVFVFEDDYPLNGEHDAGGGIDVLSPNEPGLGSFQITLFDDAGGTGDATGQPTYDMFNMPLTNSLAGTIDPVTGLDACPISPEVTANVIGTNTAPGDCNVNPNAKGCQKGIVGMIVTCPRYESDGKTLSPLAGQAAVSNLYPGRYGVVATPGADRIARGEEWLQTNTLDGQKAHDSFMRIAEPGYFQEFGPAGYHVTIGFANPKIINGRKPAICASMPCTDEVKGHVTTARMSRPPDQRLYGSGSRDSFAFTQCYASLGDPDGADFAFVKCDADGNFDFTGIPAGNWKLTVFDQWNDQIVDGISTPVGLTGNNIVLDLGEVAAHQWQANIYTRTFIDGNGNGVSDKDAAGNDLEPGLALASTNIRFRDGSFSNFNNTDLNGYAAFNEVFPLFSWYVIETDTTRYKSTGTHVVFDAGGPTDGTCSSKTAPCGSSKIGQNMANTYEPNPLPPELSVPGAVYCAEGADCGSSSIANGPVRSAPTNHSTGRIDPPFWFGSYGWQGFAGQNSFLEFGKKPFASGENGGIHGHVVYASTRPFDDPQLLLQLSWEPLVPHVKVNLYRQDVAADGLTPTLTLVDHTETSSFDDWAQGFHVGADGVTKIPNMNCPGQSTGDLFFYSLQNQPQWLDLYANGAGHTTALPYGSQFKCYDGMHNWNQLQPAPYDGMYTFPSVTSLDPTTGKLGGTNCTACVPNPDTTDPYRSGAPMLPAGKYVVEVVVPPGYELVKEEDKNILIGDNFIAPVTQQFGGLGSIFILPDQAEVGAAYNANNAQNATNSLGRVTTLPSHEGDTGSDETFWPCVGAERVVPDYISLFPGSAEVAPFAGAKRPLCDRKQVTLTEQMSALVKFYIFTPTHAASHFTGVITDDFTSEFDPFSPQFGEKFAPAYLPVSLKDWAGNEISRVYSDQFGAYNGLNYSTWEVNPPNPTGYAPTMMVVCMNDSGTGTAPDPLFQPGYSQFCYELPFMPGQTGYFDTPVVPTSAFSEGYNHPDCNYPDATPAISRVDGDGVGPWVSAAGKTLTITALGDQLVDNYGYSGPSTTQAPFNQKKVKRHYGFGTTAGTVALVGSDGVAHPLQSVSWSDGKITGTVPSNVPTCAAQQQAQYGGSTARCGQLVITAANGKTSVDTVTVTIGGKAPTRLGAGQTIQSAIDAATPGDLIIVPPGVYSELVLMWKPVRLQGVGAASTIVNANAHPAGKLDPWRRQVNCLFGLTPDGRPRSVTDTSCSAGWSYASGGPFFPTMIVDRLPFEAVLGWDATLNGNLAEQLIEPSLMGAYEGAGITVLGKGVKLAANDPDPFGGAVGAAYTAGTTLLAESDCATGPRGSNGLRANLYPGNFYCNPSSIDGLSVTNSSQGGGAIFAHAWAHNLQVANNRVYGNTGTLSGGITIGQGEHADVPLGGAGAVNQVPPGSCESSPIDNLSLPFCYDRNVNVHHNAVTLNSSIGDELFSSTPAGSGGVSFCNGADYYRFSYNWVCGNMSSGDGGGVSHIGFSKNGLIEHNQILFNQSTNPTIPTNGGGLLVMGAPDQDALCGATTDKDCVPDPTTVTPSDGTGPGLVINANLIMGNSADSGSGGGVRLQHVNGTDVLNFPNGARACANPSACRWNSVTLTNNIITDNVAGWDGAGISLQDALAVNIVNNTIASNDSTATAGVLFGSLFAPLASAPGTNCTTNNGTRSCPQVAGVVSVTNSAILKANLPATGFSCPPGHGTNGSCRNFSVPLLFNDLIWKNRSFFIGVGDFGTGTQNQQKIVSLFNSFTGTPAASQSATGACPAGASYWDVGVRGDTGPTNHSAGRLAPEYSVLTDASDYPNAHNVGADPHLLGPYCNGSRVPPENGGLGWQVPPGTNETNALPAPVFSLTPSATVDEGNNWINLRWGPLSLSNPVTGVTLGNYGIPTTSPAVNAGISTAQSGVAPPATDFFGRARTPPYDIGAVEAGTSTVAVASVTGGPLGFGNVVVGTTSPAQNLTLQNTGGATFNANSVAVTAPFARSTAGTFPAGAPDCGATLSAGASCTIKVVFSPTAPGPANGTVTITGNVPVGGSPVALTGTGVAPLLRASLAPASWNPTATRGCTLFTCPAQAFTLTNTGNVTLTGIAQGTISGAGEFSVIRLLSTCGPAGGGQLVSQTTLAPGASCIVTARFAPPTGDTTGTKSATLSVGDAAGTQTSPLTGTAQ